MQSVKKVLCGSFGLRLKTKFGEDGQLFQKLYNYNYKYLVLTRPRTFFPASHPQDESQDLSINTKIT
jgi:hypothetical protein